MMRISTLLWTALAGAIGIGLFTLKYEVQALEDRVAQLNQQIRQDQETIHVLKAEWSYLNDPARLRELAERHLDMVPLQPVQVASIAALPFAGEAEEPQVVAAPAPPAAVKRAAPVKVAAPKPAAKPSPRPVAAPAAKPAPPPALAVRSAPVQPVLAPSPAGNIIVIKSPAVIEAELAGAR